MVTAQQLQGMKIVAFASLKYYLELWLPEISALFAFCGLSRVVEKSTLPKKLVWEGRGGEQLSYNRRGRLYGK